MSERFLVIGISDVAEPCFDDRLRQRIASAKVLSGGIRHHEIVRPYISPDALWIDITVPLEPVMQQYADFNEVVVFASGDPLFYGFAATLRRRFPDAEIEVIPTFNSLQTLAHRLSEPYGPMLCVSLTGRPWNEFDAALIRNTPLIGILTDRSHTPDAIAARMLSYGYDNYIMAVGERLGNLSEERVGWYSLKEAASSAFARPCSVIIKQTRKRNIPFGIPDDMFAHLDGRPGMMTKMPVRLVSLAMLDLSDRNHLWDIGFCTGSVSIEARLRFPLLSVTAFERRSESRALIQENCRRFGAIGIEAVIGDFMDLDITSFPAPDAVFIGGHGGKLDEMLRRIVGNMSPGGRIVFNSVSDSSLSSFRTACDELGLRITGSHRIALDSFNPITILRAEV